MLGFNGSFHEAWLREGRKLYKPQGNFRYLWVPPPMFSKCEVQKPKISEKCG